MSSITAHTVDGKVVEANVGLVTAGAKLRIKKVVRSQKTGMVLPREGTLVDVTQNLGRHLYLVAFADGNSEYLFADEVECVALSPLRSNHI
jgi:hypothetical protein